MDSVLAEMYGVPTKVLNQVVKRNRERFPDDFMFQLTDQEWENLRSQFATSRQPVDKVGVAAESTICLSGMQNDLLFKKDKMDNDYYYNKIVSLNSQVIIVWKSFPNDYLS